jgi:hypothetical protein
MVCRRGAWWLLLLVRTADFPWCTDPRRFRNTLPIPVSLAAVVCPQQPDHNEYAKTLDEAGKLFGTGNFVGVIEKLGPLG